MSDEKYLYGQPVGLHEAQERIMKTRLRDNLAAAALTGLLCDMSVFVAGKNTNVKTICERAYRVADCMIEARNAQALPPLPEDRETPAQAPEAPAQKHEADTQQIKDEGQ